LNILFIHKSLYPIGGIETLIVRLLGESRLSEDVSIDLLLYQNCNKGALLESALSNAGAVKSYTGYFNALLLRTPFIDGKYDVIYCMGWRSLLLGLLYRQKYQSDAKVCVGVYHPREFCWDSSLKSFAQRLMLRVFNTIPDENIFFMNKGAMEEHEQVLGREFANSPIVPLAINIPEYTINCKSKALRIVSVGRLVDFKRYNFFMLDVVKSLREKTGLDFEYHVYGDGDCMDELLNKVVAMELKEVCFFHGSIPYSKMHKVLEEAWAFVGMGTSLIESAACGVPSITAIESEDRPVTYGFIHELDVLNCGEWDPNLVEFLIEDKLIYLAGLDENDYDNLRYSSYAKMKMYDIKTVFDAMQGAFAKAKQDRIRLSLKDRLLDTITSVFWKAVAALGVSSPLKNRYLKK